MNADILSNLVITRVRSASTMYNPEKTKAKNGSMPIFRKIPKKRIDKKSQKNIIKGKLSKN